MRSRPDDPRGIVVGAGRRAGARICPSATPVTLLVNTDAGRAQHRRIRRRRSVPDVFQGLRRPRVRIPIAAAQRAARYAGREHDRRRARSDRRHRSRRRRAAGLGRRRRARRRTWVELNDFYEKAVALYKRQFGVLQLIILVDGRAERREQHQHERVRADRRIRHDDARSAIAASKRIPARSSPRARCSD